MRLRLRYARWAVPWLAVAVCLALAAVGVALTWRQDRMGPVMVILVALLAGAAASFVLDDPAAAVTRVTARGSRWAMVTRIGCAALVTLTGLGLVALGLRGDIGGLGGWPLVLTAISLCVTASAACLVRRHRPTPGAAVASALILIGLVPFPARVLFRTTWPYPSPGLDDIVRIWWVLLGAVSALALAWAVLRPLSSVRSPAHR